MARRIQLGGAEYNITSAALTKFRRAARRAGGVARMMESERRAYGAAVEKAVLSKQRSELQRELPGHKCPCASGTWHSDGEAIGKAMRAKQHAALMAAPSRNAELSDDGWHILYNETMEQKRQMMKEAA